MDAPPPPPGFTLDKQPGNAPPPPPPGFNLDAVTKPPATPAAPPPPPPGFKLDAAPQQKPGLIARTADDIWQWYKGLGKEQRDQFKKEVGPGLFSGANAHALDTVSGVRAWAARHLDPKSPEYQSTLDQALNVAMGTQGPGKAAEGLGGPKPPPEMPPGATGKPAGAVKGAETATDTPKPPEAPPAPSTSTPEVRKDNPARKEWEKGFSRFVDDLKYNRIQFTYAGAEQRYIRKAGPKPPMYLYEPAEPGAASPTKTSIVPSESAKAPPAPSAAAAPEGPAKPMAAEMAPDQIEDIKRQADTTIPPSGVADDFRRIFSPAKRGEAASTTAGMVREGLARREQSFQQAAENLRSFGAAVGKLSPDARLAYMDAIETGKLGPYQGTKLGGLAKEIRGLFDERWRKMDELGIAPNYVQDYLPHLWQDPAKAANTFAQYGGRSLEGGKKFLKERTFATVRAGIEAGLKPVTDNPIEMSLMQLHQMDRFITARDVFDEMVDEGLAVQVPHDERPPPGWIPIADKIARAGNAHYYAPEPAATIVNRALSPGLSGQPIYDTIRSAGNMMNSAQLGLSGFHALFVIADAATSRVAKGIKQISRGEPGEIARGLGNLLGRQATAPVENYLTGRKVLNQYLGGGTYGPEMEKIVNALIAGGGRARMESFYRGSPAGSFWQAFRGTAMRSSGRQRIDQDLREMFRNAAPIKVGGMQIAPGQVRAAAQLVPRVMDTIMAPLMEDMVPKMKLGVFYDLMSDELRVNPKMDQKQLRQVAGRIWDSVDNRLGQLAYDNLFWNRTMKDIGHIAVRSLGWNLGTLRELGGGAMDIAKTGIKGREKSPGGMKQITDRASYVVAMPIMTAMMGAFYQYLKTGKGPQEFKDYFFPKTGGKDAQGGDERVSMPGYMKDAVEWANQPEQTAINKVHPLWTTLYDMMNNEQWNSAAITDTRQGQPVQGIKDYSHYLMQQFSPISIRPQTGMQESKISGPEQFFGIRQAPYSIREPDLAAEYSENRISGKVRKKLKMDARE